jgi:hypothetical protein
MVRLGNASSRGGTSIDDLVGDALAGVGLGSLPRLMDNLDDKTLATISAELSQLIAAREPVEQVSERNRIWESIAFGWTGRLYWFWLKQMLLGDPESSEPIAVARTRIEAQALLLVAEAAVRRYHLAHGAAPNAVVDLVPKYLAVVPPDPYGRGALVYRRTEDGYLLYSVGRNGTDDGGQRATFWQATHESIGDLFFDASQEPD